MADPFVAEIRLFPFTFPPKAWAFCDGQLLPLSQNTALFALLGTIYGGDGRSTFALPNFRGQFPLQQGFSNSAGNYDLGQAGGSETVTLLGTEIPVHNHSLSGATNAIPAVATAATQSSPQGAVPAGEALNQTAIYAPAGAANDFTAPILPVFGEGQAHNNMPPFLTVNFCIALQGVFPQRP